MSMTALESVKDLSLTPKSKTSLHLKSTVLADKFEFGFMESVETQFEEILVAEAEGTGEQAADFSVDTFHFSTGEPGFVIAQHALGVAKQGYRHSLKLPDAAGFCLRAPFAQEPPGLASVFLLPEFCEFLLEQVSALQGLIKNETAVQAPGGVFLQVVAPV